MRRDEQRGNVEANEMTDGPSITVSGAVRDRVTKENGVARE